MFSSMGHRYKPKVRRHVTINLDDEVLSYDGDYHKKKQPTIMPTSGKDPRSYIKSVALPITSQKGIKIQARSDKVYNPTLPERNIVRKDNYSRRQTQFRDKGFNCLPYVPYQGIGDPFYLDQKKMILHSLGQWNEEMETSSSESDDEDDDNLQSSTNKPMTPANFVLRRNRRDLHTLNKEVSSGRNMIKNVRLGHGLFHLVELDRVAKSEAKRQENAKKQERLRTECQPPKIDTSSEDETDDELAEDTDLRQYMVSRATHRSEAETRMSQEGSTQPTESPDSKSRVAFQDNQRLLSMDISLTPQSGGVTPRPVSRKKQAIPRPYTPQHSNIASELTEARDKHVLFRQLCALYWLLEAMNIEQPSVMGSISTCWSMRDVGGTKSSIQEQQREKVVDSDWKKLISNKQHVKSSVFKRLTAQKSRGPRRLSHTNTRGSMSSAGLTDSQTRLNQSGTRLDSVILEEDETREEMTEVAEAEEEDAPINHSLFSFLDEYYESLRKEREALEQGETGGDTTQDPYTSNIQPGYGDQGLSSPDKPKPSKTTPILKRKSILMSTMEVQKSGGSVKRSYDDSRISRRRRGTTTLRADHLVRPKSSPALLEFEANRPSNRACSMTMEMRQKFAEVSEEQALLLHDALDAMDRQRLRVLQNKFRHMPTGGSSFHRALSQMRSRSIIPDDGADQRRRSSIHQTWYSDLLHNIPAEVREDWFIDKILNKLNKYGMVESAKQSAYKFLKVLSNLRQWEICNPDISAAIEFCREKIIEMSVEEYEEWFSQTFPLVVRPHTAPASMTKDKRHAENKSKPTRVSASAPPGGR